MEYLVYAPRLGETADTGEQVSASSLQLAVSAWCKKRFQKDPEFARTIDGQTLVITGVEKKTFLCSTLTYTLIVNVRVPDPEFEISEVQAKT